jgi:hypothetical protein
MKSWLRPLVACVLTLVSGCGGSENTGSSGSPADNARITTLHAVEDFIASQEGPQDAASRDKIAQYLKSRPEFEAAEALDDGSVYGRFTDGRILIVAAPRIVSGTPVDAPDPSPVAITDPDTMNPGPGTLARDVPKVGVVKLFDSLGTGFGNTMPTLAAQYTSFGYQLATGAVQGGSLEEWKALGNEGYFSVDAHGGTGKSRDGTERLGIWTGTVASAEVDAANSAQLDENSLVYLAASNNGKTETHYAVTDLFITKYVKFADRTVVFINACNSGKVPLAKAFTGSNANLYLGWSAPVEDTDAGTFAYYLADRVLGRFKMPPAKTGVKVPLTWNEFYTDITTAVNPKTNDRYAHSKTANADLKVFAGPGTVFTLPPTILSGRMNSESKEVLLFGNFGSVPGTVVENPNDDGTGGKEIPVVSWTETSIKATGTAVDAPKIIAKVDTRRTNVFKIPGGQYIIYGAALDHTFRVRDRIAVYRNSTKIFEDPADRVDSPHAPIRFQAMSGDAMRVQIYSSGTYGGAGRCGVQTPSRHFMTLIADGTLDLSPNKTTGLALTRDYRLWDAEPVQ